MGGVGPRFRGLFHVVESGLLSASLSMKVLCWKLQSLQAKLIVCDTVSRPCAVLWKLLILALRFSTARTDRYNHGMETDDDEEDDEEFACFSNEFSNFSTCSPRYSRICSSPTPSPVHSPVPSPGPTSPVSPVNGKKACDSKDSGEEVSTPRSDQSSESSPPTVRRKGLDEQSAADQSESQENDEGFRRQQSDSGVKAHQPRCRSSSTSE